EAAEASGESGHGFLNDLHELEERADQRQLVQLSEAEAAAKRGRQMGEADRDNLDRLPFHSSAPLTPVRHIVIPKALVYVAAAAMALIVVGLWLRSPRPPQSAPAPTPMVTAEPTDPVTGPLVVAHLRGSIDAQWGVGESS